MGAKALREKRAKLWEENKALLDKATAEGRDFTPSELSTWEARDKEIDAIKAQVDRAERTETLTAEMEARVPMPWGLGPPEGYDERSAAKPHGVKSEWLDVRTGERLPVFGPKDSLRSHYRVDPEFRVGRVLLARATGDKRFLSRAEVRAMEGQSDLGGGFMLPSMLSPSVIDLARSRSVAIAAGARIVPMETAELKLARIDTDPTVSWVAENTQLSETSPVFGQVRLQARTCRAYIPISAELASDAANAVEAMERAVAGALGLALDKAVLFGGATGDADEPIGIRNTTGVGTVSVAGTPTDYSKWSSAVEACLTQNAPEPLSVMAHPRTFGTLDRLEDSTGQPLRPLPSWEALKKFSTTSISVTEGSPADDSYSIVGPFGEVLIGIRLGAQIIEGPIEPTKWQRQFVAVLRADVALTRPSFFTVLTGIDD